jgi:hypothetical protein
MFYFLASILSFSAFAKAPEELSNSKKWHKLLHYKKTLTRNYESQADGMGFFLHPKGKWDPRLELEAAIELLGKTSKPKDGDAACKFPARLKWLNQELGQPWRVDLSGCTKYLEFFSKVAAKRASIVFSSYYLGNPNSSFGHTFLRLSRYDDKRETEMLDYGINYAAESHGANPFTYAFKGLFGGFKGRFTAMPYYYKVREYSDFEFRDLWSYDLKLTMPQVLEMVDHIWELGHTDFDYYYFLENCSYHLLSVLEVVLPDRDLTGKYSIFAIPADTIRLLKEEDLIGPGQRRESTYTRLTRLSEKLTLDSLGNAREIIERPEDTGSIIQGMDDQKAANTLDVAIEGFDYFNSEKILKDDPKTMQTKDLILRARAVNPLITADAQVLSLLNESPAEVHPPTRWSLGQGYRHRQGKQTIFEARSALHDLLDPMKGSLKEGQIEMGRVSIGLRQKDYGPDRLVFEDLSILTIKNFPAQTFWAKPFSWEIELGVKQLYRNDCFNCPASVLMGSFGNTFSLIDQRLLLALLINGEFNLQNYFHNGYRVGVGPKIVSRFILSEQWVVGLESWYHLNTYGTKHAWEEQELWSSFELRNHFTKDTSWFVKFRGHERSGSWLPEGLLGLQYFH